MAKRKARRTRKVRTQKKVRVKVGNKTIECLLCHSSVSVDKDTAAIVCSTCTARVAGSPEQIGKTAGKKVAPKLDEKGHKIKSKRKGNNNVKKGAKIAKLKGAQRGWWFRADYTHTDGKKYSYGQPVSGAVKPSKKVAA